VLYLATFSSSSALSYFHVALKLCRLTGVQPSLLLHPLDFLGCDDISDLDFFPAMHLPSQQKLSLMSKILDSYSSQFRVVTMKEHADCVEHVGAPLVANSQQPRDLL
jgi:hypothetical protein